MPPLCCGEQGVSEVPYFESSGGRRLRRQRDGSDVVSPVFEGEVGQVLLSFNITIICA